MEPSEELNAWSGRVVGAAIEVHRHLGPCYVERVYGNALAAELHALAVPFRREVPVEARYKGLVVGHGQLDFLVADRIVVELKAVEQLLPIHTTQLLYYLRAARAPLGLLLNFHAPTLKKGLVRVVNSATPHR
jgi:GxxExxY protein